MKPGARALPATERPLGEARSLGGLSLEEAYDLFQDQDRRAVGALEACRAEVVRTVELAVERLARGGRLLYVGAGTSGRLAVLDAAECPPTFQSDPQQVQAVIAGGPNALLRAVEGAEDSRELGRSAMDERGVNPNDLVLGISASGTAPFVRAALDRARELGAATTLLACVPRDEEADDYDVSIRIESGPEILAGSTRLKAGTVTKLVLNRISTLSMARLGKTYQNLMVDVNTRGNQKLQARGVALVASIGGVDPETARALLEAADGRVKTAAVMARLGLDAQRARSLLDEHDGFLERVLTNEDDEASLDPTSCA